MFYGFISVGSLHPYAAFHQHTCTFYLKSRQKFVNYQIFSLFLGDIKTQTSAITKRTMKHSINDLREMFESYLAQIEVPAEPERLYTPFIYSMSGGGKRLRPALLLAAYNVFADDIATAMPAATAIEVFHNFTLLHDDIMDNAVMRRGRKSVYAKWGVNVALLSGDAMLIAAYRMLRKSPTESLPRILDIFNTMALQVCEGQQYDMDFESARKISVVDYMHMIELKTAVLLAGATTIGAVLGGASDDDCRKLHRFALELGMAFQLQDDLLDCYGDTKTLGKRIGGDILEGKKTFLAVKAMSLADEPDREILRSTYRDKNLTDDEKIARVLDLYNRLDIPRQTEQQISIRFERALTQLETLSVGAEATKELSDFAKSLMGRKK